MHRPVGRSDELMQPLMIILALDRVIEEGSHGLVEVHLLGLVDRVPHADQLLVEVLMRFNAPLPKLVQVEHRLIPVDVPMGMRQLQGVEDARVSEDFVSASVNHLISELVPLSVNLALAAVEPADLLAGQNVQVLGLPPLVTKPMVAGGRADDNPGHVIAAVIITSMRRSSTTSSGGSPGRTRPLVLPALYAMVCRT